MEREAEILDSRLKAMAKELRKIKKRIRRKSKIVASRAVRVAASRAVKAAVQVQYACHGCHNLYV